MWSKGKKMALVREEPGLRAITPHPPSALHQFMGDENCPHHKLAARSWWSCYHHLQSSKRWLTKLKAHESKEKDTSYPSSRTNGREPVRLNIRKLNSQIYSRHKLPGRNPVPGRSIWITCGANENWRLGSFGAKINTHRPSTLHQFMGDENCPHRKVAARSWWSCYHHLQF